MATQNGVNLALSGSTGTGSFVGSVSPTFTGTPVLPTPFTLGATSVTSTGTQLNLLNGLSAVPITTIAATVYTSGTNAFTPNAKTTYIYYELCAGGGGGGGGDNGNVSRAAAGGGASGSIAKGIITRAQAVEAGTQLQVVIGAAGAAGTAGNNTGGTGGTSTLIANNGAGSTIASCLGGLGGVGATSGGVSSLITLGGAGQAATISVGTQIQASAGNNGGIGVNGEGTGVFRGFSSFGANSPYGAGAIPQSTIDTAGNAGSGNGSGGGGAYSIAQNRAGGAGTAGYCLLVEYEAA